MWKFIPEYGDKVVQMNENIVVKVLFDFKIQKIKKKN